MKKVSSEPRKEKAEPEKMKKGSCCALVVVIIISIIVLPIAGFFVVNPFIQGEIEKVRKNGFSFDEGKAVINTNQDQTWPQSISPVIPKFESGKIKSSVKVNEAWAIAYSNAYFTEVNQYKATLVSQGWAIDKEAVSGSLKSYTAKKDGYLVTPMFDVTKSEFTLSIAKEATPQNK